MNDDIRGDQTPTPNEPQRIRHEEPKSEQPAAQQPGQQTPPPPPPGYYYQGPPQYMPYPPPQQPRRLGWLIPASFAIGCLPWLLLFFCFIGLVANVIGGTSGKHVALVHITGQITGAESGGGLLSSVTVGSEDVIKQLEKIRKNDSVKAVVIRINSPGGSASGSEEIYNEIKRVRESGKLVYASMGDVAASGGYYIASACDKIYANANTLTGSIGVIFSLADLSDLYRKVGYRPEVIKAGKYKDIGSPSRPITAEERGILQGVVDETYMNFLTAVAKGRNLPLAQVKQLAEGRIYTGTQAAKIKLIDKIGGLQETIKEAALAGGIAGTPKVVEYGKKGLFGTVLSGESESASNLLTDTVRKEFVKKFLQDESDLRGLK